VKYTTILAGESRGPPAFDQHGEHRRIGVVVLAVGRDDVVAVVRQAEGVATTCEDIADVTTCTRTEVSNFDEALVLPVGWTQEARDDGLDVKQALGWVIAAAAVAQGAPFWFDLLRRIARR
jgi:hypothetical protein